MPVRFIKMIVISVLLLTYFTESSAQINEGAGDITFDHLIIDPSPPSASGCCLDVLSIGDIDGDGKADIVVGSEYSMGVVWYHYPSWTRYVIGSGNFTTDGEIVDLDGDGDGDVVISSNSRNAIEWWENLGNPFEQGGWARHKIGSNFAHDLAIGDINADGNPDVVMLKKGSAKQLTWFEASEDPRGSWAPHQIDTPDGEGVDLGDLDGDGDLDIAASRIWYENVGGDGLTWRTHTTTASWRVDCRDIIADMNGDGRLDIVLSHSEGSGRVSWFENPSWTEHPIESGSLSGAHSLEVGDFDSDGDPDVLVGEMHTSSTKRILVYENLGAGDLWDRITLANTGTHNARIGDIGGDGDLDIVGKNYNGPKVVEMWENKSDNGSSFQLDKWTYMQVDNNRNDRYFGLAMGDITGDGYQDIVSGAYFYRNPGGDMTASWTRVTFSNDVDAMLIVDVDGDALADVIAQKLPDIYWLEAKDAQGIAWTSIKVATMPATSHGNGQGYTLAQIVPGGRPELLFSGGTGNREIYHFTIPSSNPAAGNWPRVRITDEATDEGIGVGDIDGDGDPDIAAGDMYTGGDRIAWWENPGNGAGNWTKHKIGTVGNWPDRFAVGDINGDGLLDIVVSEETGSGNASVYWFEQPFDPGSRDWVRHWVVTQYTTNSMDVADMDNDGDLDIITGEHRGSETVAIWENDGRGNFIEYVVDTGRESHLGARVADLDGDGDLDIASIAWDDYQFLHLWRNDAQEGETRAVVRPEISPNGGAFSGQIHVTLSTATPGAELHYTLDSTTPTRSSTLYSHSFALTTSATVKVRGFKDGFDPSSVATANFTIEFDDTPPTIDSVIANGNPIMARVRFSEAVERASAEDVQNYAIVPGVSVLIAALGEDSKTVTLTTSGFSEGVLYTLMVDNVEDRASPPNVIESGAQATFQYTNSRRVSEGLAALYTFAAGAGDVVYDVSGSETPLDLTILDPGKIRWLNDEKCLEIVGPGSAIKSAPAIELNHVLMGTRRLTLEAWVTPASLNQEGPSRIVTLSEGTSTTQVNVHLGQENGAGSFRLRTPANAFSWLKVPEVFTNTQNPRHLVVTYDGSVQRMYVDGVLQGTTKGLTGDFSNWDPAYALTFGNEVSFDRSWLGKLHLVAIYDRALTTMEIRQNFEVGPRDAGLPGCSGDLNKDGRVDVADLQSMVNIILGTSSVPSCADLNGNGVVDIVDLQTLVNRILGV